MPSDGDTEFATVSVEVTREIRVPTDLLGDDLSLEELRERAGDWFWNHWRECLANEPGPTKDDVTVSSVAAPKTFFKTDDGERACTECGTSVEDEPYEYWLFHTCQNCASTGGESDA